MGVPDRLLAAKDAAMMKKLRRNVYYDRRLTVIENEQTTVRFYGCGNSDKVLPLFKEAFPDAEVLITQTTAQKFRSNDKTLVIKFNYVLGV